MNKWMLLVLGLLLCTPFSLALEFNQTITPEEQEQFDTILEPVMRIYSFIKYAATALAVLFLLFAAVTFIVSGRDQAKRESAKQTALYIVLGLILIWVAPLVVLFLVG